MNAFKTDNAIHIEKAFMKLENKVVKLYKSVGYL